MNNYGYKQLLLVDYKNLLPCIFFSMSLSFSTQLECKANSWRPDKSKIIVYELMIEKFLFVIYFFHFLCVCARSFNVSIFLTFTHLGFTVQ